MTTLKVIHEKASKKEKVCIKSDDDVLKLMSFLKEEVRENFYILHLDAKNNVLSKELISVGSLTNSIIHPREVFKGAILNNSASIICVHNHPSGNPTPSSEDIQITRRLLKVSELVGIKVLDHIIIGRDNYYSFAHTEDKLTSATKNESSMTVLKEGGDYTGKEREGYFDPGCITELCNDLILHNLNLRALGELIHDSDLETFAGTESDKEDLRFGLKKIIELCIDEQERIAQEYVDQYHKSDVALFKKATATHSMIRQGAFRSPADEIKKTLRELDTVICRGGEYKERAEMLKEGFLEDTSKLGMDIKKLMEEL